MRRVMRLLRRAICWLLGHNPAWQRVVYKDKDHNLLPRMEHRCTRCDRRVPA